MGQRPFLLSGPEAGPKAMAGWENLVPPHCQDPRFLAKPSSWLKCSKGNLGHVIEGDVAKSIMIKAKSKICFNCIEQKSMLLFDITVQALDKLVLTKAPRTCTLCIVPFLVLHTVCCFLNYFLKKIL